MTRAPRSTHQDEGSLTGLIKSLINQVVGTGLGALAKIQQEGFKLVESFIQQRESVEMQKKPAVKAETVKSQSQGDFSGLEAIFENRVARTLQRLQVPTREDLQNVYKQIDKLQKSIEKLTKNKSKSKI